MKKLNKKAFTIVELVIVIAVIAVLAAVLIPTFTKLIRKSKVSSDTAFIKELNGALAADKADGNEHVTMTDALNATASFGLDVVKINAKASKNEFLWDSKNDVFCYLNEGTIEYYPNSVSEEDALKAGDPGLWKIYRGSVPATGDQTYSIYLGDEAAAASMETVGTVKVGIDCGEQPVANLTYENTSSSGKDVVIRTNSASTNIVLNPYVDSTDSTKGDHISFYGKAGQITGPKDEDGNYTGFTVAFNSIAIKGKVIGLKVASGHIDLTNAVLEDDEEIIILATTTDVKVSNPNKVKTHAHATSESNANAMNDPADSTKKSVGVTWDYDGNVAQNEIDDIHHHITEEQATEAGESLGTGSIDGGGEWDYEEVVEEVVYVASNKEVSENAAYVARIGGQGYETLEAAFTAAVNGDTIVMLKDVSTDNGTYGTSNYINISKTITLDLAGYGVTNNKSVGFFMPATATVGGVIFTIDDNSNNKTGYIISSKSHGIQVGSKNYIVVNNGRIEGIGSGIQASQYCSVTINDGVVKSNHTGSSYYAGIYSSHYDVSVTINGGTVIGKRAVWVGYNGDSLTVNGGTIEGTTYGVTASNGATVVVNDGTIKATGAVLANYGIYVNGPTASLTVNGGTITAKIKAVQASYSTVNIAGGTFNATGYNAGANDSYALLLYGTDTTITGGKFVNDNAWTTSGKYQYGIYFANVQDANKVVTNGSLSVKDADITATQTGILFTTNAECLIKDCNITAIECILLAHSNAVCTVDGGNYNSNGSQVLYAQKGFFNVIDGTFTGSGSTNVEDHIYRYTLNCLDASYNANPATAGFTVTGGSFYQFNPENDLSEGENTRFTPEGYHTEYNESTGYYTVVENN